MTNDRTPTDPDLEEQLRAAFARTEPPTAPESLRESAREMSDRETVPVRRGPFASMPLAFAAVAVLVTVGLAGIALSQGRHSTTQGEELVSPGATASGAPTLDASTSPSRSAEPSATVMPTASAQSGNFIPGRYRSTTALQGRWCIDLNPLAERYDADRPIEVQTWPPTTDAACNVPPDPEAPRVDDQGWNEGRISRLADGTTAIFVELFVNMESDPQELDLQIEPTEDGLDAVAASFGGEHVRFERVGPAQVTPREPDRPIDPAWIGPPLAPVAGNRLTLAEADSDARAYCGSAPIPYAAFGNETDAAVRVGPEFDALRELVHSPMVPLVDPSVDLPWAEVRRTDSEIEFLAEVDAGKYVYVTLQADGEDGWKFAGLGDCTPKAWPSMDYSPGNWVLDPAYPRPFATSTTLHVLVTEVRCASGKSALGRISPAFVFPTRDEVAIQLFVQDPGRGQDCRNPAEPAAVRLDLPEPLGRRTLRDGNIIECRYCGG
jgi:hypothetical protein